MSRTYGRDDIDRFMQRCRLLKLQRDIQRRFDRCCHGGPVCFRLTLGERLYAANRFARASR